MPSSSDRRTEVQAQRAANDGRVIATSGRTDQALHTSTLVFDDGVSPAGLDDYLAALCAEQDTPENALSVYVHLPFCPSRCLTCDHETTVSHDLRQIDHYLDSLEREVALVTSNLGAKRTLQQLHLGGGTPNYLTEVQLVRLVDILDHHFIIDDTTATSLEANAHRASVSQLALLHGLGFKALNLEIRDLDLDVQAALGRHQSLSVIRDVVESARDIGFETVSTDLVYGLPAQTLTSMRNTVEQLLTLQADNINCYRYSRRPESFNHQRAVDEGQMPSLGDTVAVFSRIVDGLCDAGYQWVGTDCFSREDSVISKAHREGVLHRNRIGYTTKEGGSLLGFGSSSTSDLSGISVRNHMQIEPWRDAIGKGELPIGAGQKVTQEARERRRALSDLMCNLKLHGQQYASNDGETTDPTLQALKADGIIEFDGDSVVVTESGRFKLHQVCGDASPTYRWGL
ncbi:MAG: radical SAM protein [Congregibacter sp.]